MPPLCESSSPSRSRGRFLKSTLNSASFKVICALPAGTRDADDDAAEAAAPTDVGAPSWPARTGLNAGAKRQQPTHKATRTMAIRRPPYTSGLYGVSFLGTGPVTIMQFNALLDPFKLDVK